MSEWWSYRPSDFLMFAPRTYWRLFELHNVAWWPAQPVVVATMLACIACLVRWQRTAREVRDDLPALRLGALVLALASAFVAWAFLLQRYAPINWVAPAFAAGLFVQAALLLVLAVRGRWQLATDAARRRIGLLVCGWAAVGHPLLAPAAGRPWSQAEFAALTPDPTVIATLGFLLLVRPPPERAAAWLLRAVWTTSLGWCAVSAATLWTMGSAQGWVVFAAALLAGCGAWSRR